MKKVLLGDFYIQRVSRFEKASLGVGSKTKFENSWQGITHFAVFGEPYYLKCIDMLIKWHNITYKTES